MLALSSAFTGVDCGVLSDPLNGVVILDQGTTRFGDEARYECNEGYNMTSGDGIRTCTAGTMWSGEEPQCERKLNLVLVIMRSICRQYPIQN